MNHLSLFLFHALPSCCFSSSAPIENCFDPQAAVTYKEGKWCASSFLQTKRRVDIGSDVTRSRKFQLQSLPVIRQLRRQGLDGNAVVEALLADPTVTSALSFETPSHDEAIEAALSQAHVEAIVARNVEEQLATQKGLNAVCADSGTLCWPTLENSMVGCCKGFACTRDGLAWGTCLAAERSISLIEMSSQRLHYMREMISASWTRLTAAVSNPLEPKAPAVVDAPRKLPHFDLVIIQPSHWSEHSRRSAVRDSWANYFGNGSKCQICQQYTVTRAFLVGNDVFTGSSATRMQQEAFRTEAQKFGDLFVLSDFQEADVYKNRSAKTLHCMKWAIEHYSFDLLLKLDTDSFLFADRLLNFLKEGKYFEPNEPLYVGKFAEGPQQVVTGKAITEANKKWQDDAYYEVTGLQYYPAHAKGPGYILSYLLVKYLAYPQLPWKSFTCEDTAIGSYLMAIDYTKVDMPTSISQQGCTRNYASPMPVLDHYVAPQTMRQRWQRLDMYGDPCKAFWTQHVGRSCQTYAGDDDIERSLADSQAACLDNKLCVAVMCPTGQTSSCTLRGHSELIDYAPEDCYVVQALSPPPGAPTCNITVASQLSLAPCRSGTSFGCEDDGVMYVDNGCRGEFNCNGNTVSCSSEKNGRTTCFCQATTAGHAVEDAPPVVLSQEQDMPMRGSSTIRFAWQVSLWGACSARCNQRGVQKRHVQCVGSDGEQHDMFKCQLAELPHQEQPCIGSCTDA